MPAYLLTSLVLNRFGRKELYIGTMWFSGVFCLIGSLLNNADVTWRVIRMLFPTEVRNVALGGATQAVHLGAILAPFVVVLGGNVPFALFGLREGEAKSGLVA
ncbi:hypothetical protein KY285_031589 [Solanum tuberosum]|nr:hypothetical protein KY284_031378 [Solanum tuberosum]KAH0654120.1 hypothetical protein KY289_031798 [Solanum tuberosum]KAH0656707.1 hypothetical protein KY285_031589 [Solanum tuberosum]